jgi:hypothetical protein
VKAATGKDDFLQVADILCKVGNDSIPGCLEDDFA